MIVNYNGKDVKLPDFFIVGAAKSGTTSLHYYLKQHPEIFMPKVKELWFLCFMDTAPPKARTMRGEGLIVSSFTDYITYFEEASNNQVIGEACPSYLYLYKDTIRNIKKVYGGKCKDLKIIIILRNPADRAWSQFTMGRRDGTEPLKNFKEAIKPEVISQRKGQGIGYDYVGYGAYYEQVNAFMMEFRNVKVFLYDELSIDTANVIKDMFGFLAVDAGFTPDMQKKYNVSGEVRKLKLLNKIISAQYLFKSILKSFLPYNTRQNIKFKIYEKIIQRQDMPDDLRRDLVNLYRDDILKLQGLIKKDLSMWIK